MFDGSVDLDLLLQHYKVSASRRVEAGSNPPDAGQRFGEPLGYLSDGATCSIGGSACSLGLRHKHGRGAPPGGANQSFGLAGKWE